MLKISRGEVNLLLNNKFVHTIYAGSMIATGLLGCIMVEIYLKFIREDLELKVQGDFRDRLESGY